jgi:polysaccharide export outer membrane protein
VGRAARSNRRRPKWRGIELALLTLASLFSTMPARAEYRVDVGDLIEISVARVPELQRRVQVGPDGAISFPLIGAVVVAGLLPSELETKIKAVLAAKIFKPRASDGREYAVVIDPEEITAVVVQFRPVFVTGDVSRPGEQAFRPLMTVRQAVALSGGYDTLRMRMENPTLLSLDLKGEYQSLSTELAKEEVRVWRVKAELGEEETLRLTPMPLPQPRIAETQGTEAERLKVEQADHQREKSFLERSILQQDEHIKVLVAQQAKEDEGVQVDTDELQRVVELFGRGTLPSIRVTEARRALLLAFTMKMQTAAQLMQVKRQREDVIRQLERLNDQRRIQLLQELQDARTALGRIHAKLQSTGEKLQYATERSRLVPGGELKPNITIIRNSHKQHERMKADEDFELQPGDVVDVVLRLDNTIGWDTRTPASATAAQTDAPADVTFTAVREQTHFKAVSLDATVGLDVMPTLNVPDMALNNKLPRQRAARSHTN